MVYVNMRMSARVCVYVLIRFATSCCHMYNFPFILRLEHITPVAQQHCGAA